MDALLIYNPAAGRISVRPFIGSVIRTLNDHGLRVEVAESLNGRHTTQLAHMAAQEKFRAVFTIGGDGTAGQTAAGLVGSTTALGILPAGTANVWGVDVGMKPFIWPNLRSLRENAGILAECDPCSIDMGRCNGLPFLMWAGIGLDAMTVHKLSGLKHLDKYFAMPEYFATTVMNVTMWHGMHLRVSADEKKVEGHYLLAVASNIRHYIGGMAEISPGALLNDGLMDMWLFSGSTLVDAFRHFFDLLSGRHLTSDQARCIPFHQVTIESETPFSVQMDGEPMQSTANVRLEVLPGKLCVLIPPAARLKLCSHHA